LNHGFETRSFPNSLAATLRGFTFCVAAPSSSAETRSFPNSLAATLRGFTFYLAVPSARFADDTDETNDEARQIVLLLVVVLVIERTRLIEEEDEDDDEDEDFRTSQRLTVLERGLLTAARFPLGP